MNNADKFSWKFLIVHGSVIGSWSYYGSHYEEKPQKTKECQHLIEEVGIDWNKTKPVQDDIEHGFEGTFCDASTVKIMRGTLVLNDGSEWKWGKSEIEPKDIITFMIEYGLPDPFKEN